MAEENALEALIYRQQQRLRAVSSQRPRLFWWRKPDPELLKVYGIIQAHLSEIQRLLILREAVPSKFLSNLDGLRKNLGEMLEKDITSSAINEVWELADALRRTLLLLSDDGYILARLLAEKQRNADDQDKLNWKASLDEQRLDTLIASYGTPANLTPETRSQAIECLSLLYGTRADFGRHQRAAIDLKTRYLGRLRSTLTTLLVLLVLGAFLVAAGSGFKIKSLDAPGTSWYWIFITFPFSIFLNDQQVRFLLIAAFAGGIGSVLSGFFKLRDNLSKLSDLRSFKAAMSAQPFVGATIGVLFYLIIYGGIFRLGLTQVDFKDPATIPWALIGVYCFIAGFSEPFFLGVVNSVAGAAEKRVADETKAGGQPGGGGGGGGGAGGGGGK